MTMVYQRSLLLMVLFGVASVFPACGDSPCQRLCSSLENKIEDNLAVDVDCNSSAFASAGNCAECLEVFKTEYQVSVIDPQVSCLEFFGTDDICAGVDCNGHGTCVSSSEVTRCECEPGYHEDGLTCLPDS
ncbi:MAG: hypothetical protein DRI34_05760 [Deltaproteobacteria bacterium]|nr:MAG: hypothetical protein DRI34_05760 [Deltaproteobacteria bacterium]